LVTYEELYLNDWFSSLSALFSCFNLSCNGKEPWSAYQMQFELISEHNNWTASVKAIELLTALKYDAMVYASFIPSDVKSSFSSLFVRLVEHYLANGFCHTAYSLCQQF
jgi:hypothetical protein